MPDTAPTPLPPIPRPITPRASRRSWFEPRVRNWWLCAFILVAVAAAYTLLRLPQLNRQRALINNGTRVKAKVELINGVARGTIAPDGPAKVELSYVDAAGPHTLRGDLTVQRTHAGIGKTLEIIVNPNSGDWTDRLSVAWFDTLLVPLILTPVIILAMAMAILGRGAVLRIWRTAPAIEAVVVDSRHSGFYPLSRIVRLTLTEDRDGRIFAAVIPHRQANLAPGDTLQVVAPPHKPQAAIAASLYL